MLAQKRTKNAPDFGDFSAMNPEKCNRLLAPDKDNCLVLFVIMVLYISV